MVPTMKKPSGVRSGWNLQTAAPACVQPSVVVEQDEDETDQGGEEESEDIKPAGRLIRSSSVSRFIGTRRLTNIVQSRPSSLSPSSSRKRGRKERELLTLVYVTFPSRLG